MITLIAAMSNNRVIGINNKLPWHLLADLQHFKHHTLGKTIIMGRKTYDSIGKPLPKRHNVILSSNRKIKDCTVVNTIDEILKIAADLPSVFIIGGVSLYKQMLSYADKLLLTIVDVELDGDAYFPEFSLKQWQQVTCESHSKDHNNQYDYRFINYKNIH